MRLPTVGGSIGFLIAALFSSVTWSHENSTAAVKQDTIKIDHPWARATPSSASATGSYLALRNLGMESDTLMGGSTPVADRIEVHTMSMDNGIARMRPLPQGIEIPPGATVELSPGGVHLMLIGPKRELIEGERFQATLEFARFGALDTEFLVRRDGTPESGHRSDGSAKAP